MTYKILIFTFILPIIEINRIFYEIKHNFLTVLYVENHSRLYPFKVK